MASNNEPVAFRTYYVACMPRAPRLVEEGTVAMPVCEVVYSRRCCVLLAPLRIDTTGRGGKRRDSLRTRAHTVAGIHGPEGDNRLK